MLGGMRVKTAVRNSLSGSVGSSKKWQASASVIAAESRSFKLRSRGLHRCAEQILQKHVQDFQCVIVSDGFEAMNEGNQRR